MHVRRICALLLAASFVGACSGASAEDASSDEQGVDSERRRHKDGGADAVDGGNGDSADGPPTRRQCTTSFGSGLSGAYGRLDGVIVSVIAPGNGPCNADRHHVHIQVESGGATYDVAVNTDSGFIAQRDLRMPGGAWAEGWHKDVTLDYPTDFGLHSTDFSAENEAQIDQDVEKVLAAANHVSVFATPYNHSGVHLVHRQGKGHDGAVITDPLSPTSHVLAFHFSGQSF